MIFTFYMICKCDVSESNKNESPYVCNMNYVLCILLMMHSDTIIIVCESCAPVQNICIFKLNLNMGQIYV